MPKASKARILAHAVLVQARERNAFVDPVFAKLASREELSASDAGFARLLCRGVVTCKGTLDEVIDAGVADPGGIDGDVRDALRISAYEIIFLGKEPYAAVSQGVELVRSFKPRAARFANFCLRRVVEAASGFPFGDAESDVPSLARSQGFPGWLAHALVDQMGFERAANFMRASNAAPVVYVANNACRQSFDALREELDAYGLAYDEVRLGSDDPALSGCIRLQKADSVASEPVAGMLARGQVLVADACAQAIVLLALGALSQLAGDAAADVSILEIGSGRGTKTVLLQSGAQRMWGRPAKLTCVDRYAFKNDVALKRCELCACPPARFVCADATDLSDQLGTERFDLVFLDAPCTGVGTLRRHPEIRWNLTAERVGELARLQLGLLREASRYVAQGGVLAYSTCTVFSCENAEVVKSFLESDEGAAFDIVPLHLGGQNRLLFSPELSATGPDAHFACVMVRTRV